MCRKGYKVFNIKIGRLTDKCRILVDTHLEVIKEVVKPTQETYNFYD